MNRIWASQSLAECCTTENITYTGQQILSPVSDSLLIYSILTKHSRSNTVLPWGNPNKFNKKLSPHIDESVLNTNNQYNLLFWMFSCSPSYQINQFLVFYVPISLSDRNICIDGYNLRIQDIPMQWWFYSPVSLQTLLGFSDNQCEIRVFLLQ